MKKTRWIAIIAMVFLCGMISFVTNLAAPIGNVWKYAMAGSNTAGMMGNLMNFAAYLVAGVPSGAMLSRLGYKRTALVAIATGFAGVLIQYLSGLTGGGDFGFAVYLAGAFVAGISMCLLNVVTNPMLNTLGGGGRRGNQLNMIGMTFNSVTGTLTPLLVGMLIGEITSKTKMADVNLVLYIALGVFAAVFAVLSMLRIEDPEGVATSEKIGALEPLRFRHTLFGVIGIFCYVGVEVGIPATMNLWLSAKDGPLSSAGVDGYVGIAGCVAATYWMMMIVGRTIGSAIGGKVSTGSDIPNQNQSFFDNVTFEYRLDDTANKYVKLFYENNVYDWLDGYTQEYGVGFIWRRSLQHFKDIFSLKSEQPYAPLRPVAPRDSLHRSPSDTTIIHQPSPTTHE